VVNKKNSLNKSPFGNVSSPSQPPPFAAAAASGATTTPSPFGSSYNSSPSTTSHSTQSYNTPSTNKKYYFDDDDDDKSTIQNKLRSLASAIPNPASVLKVPKVFKGGKYKNEALNAGWGDDDDDDFGVKHNSRGGKKSAPVAAAATKKRPVSNIGHGKQNAGMMNRIGSGSSGGVPHPIAALIGRTMLSSSPTKGGVASNQQQLMLLSNYDIKKCTNIGRCRAALDVVCLSLLFATVKELVPYYVAPSTSSSALLDQTKGVLTSLLNMISSSLLDSSWAYFAFIAAILTRFTTHLLLDPSIHSTAAYASNTLRSNVNYAQLYLRLVSSITPKKLIPTIMSNTAFHQVWSTVERVRLQTFIFAVLSTILVMFVAVVKPIIHAFLDAIENIFTLDGWSSSPLELNAIWTELRESALSPLWNTLTTLMRNEWNKVAENPLRIVVNTSLFAALILVALLPGLEKSRATKSLLRRDKNASVSTAVMNEDDAPPYSSADSSAVSSIGASSATRLDLLSRTNAVERTLERWRMMQPRNDASAVTTAVMESGPAANMIVLLRRSLYAVVSAIILSVPLVLFWFIMINPEQSTLSESSPLFIAIHMAIMLFYTHTLSNKAMRHTIESTRFLSTASVFIRSLSNTVKEVSSLRQSPQADLQLTAATSPTAGIAVNDLWAAHAAKRDWAVKGANLYCRNGEVVLLLGDDGSGKTRLLTAIGEQMLCPVARAKSTIYARGSVSVGGLETPKWDRMQLRKRLGLVLNDVRTVGDTAELFSGCSLEEILEPIGAAAAGNANAKEKIAIDISMKITGLSETLLPKLPSQLSTVIAANEDELSPSPVRPPSYPLSPSQWSKVLLAKTIAQTIVHNEYPLSSPNPVIGCMVGSVLLLDDVTVHLSEVDEANLIKALRSTGAAVLVATNRWASGRFADRVVVIKDGSVVESGTHSELIALGPEGSVYAAKWNELTSA